MRLHLIFTFLLIQSCQKETASDSDCNDFNTLRIVTNAPATISFFENQYFIIEQNTIDTRLVPCTLPDKFQKDKLMVTVSGEVKMFKNKQKVQICCTERIVLSKIEER